MIISLLIPSDVHCLLNLGQKVNFDTPFLERKVMNDYTIPIAKKLQVVPAKIFKYLKKFVGDEVKVGDVLASKKTFFNSDVVKSEYAGFIKEIDHLEGNISISNEKEKSTLLAYFIGEVVEVKIDQIKIKVKDGLEFALKNATTNFGGQIFILKDHLALISEESSFNKILIAEGISSYLRAKAEALGIKGFVNLKQPPKDTKLPTAQIKSMEDFKKILSIENQYCLIDSNYRKIYFYS